MSRGSSSFVFFFFNDTATTEIYTLSLHDALPISVAQLVPNAEILVVTTPQQAAAEVAERAGTIALQTRQRIAGVVENMSWLPCPHCGEKVDVFGSGGGQTVADALTRPTGAQVPLLGHVPIDIRL